MTPNFLLFCGFFFFMGYASAKLLRKGTFFSIFFMLPIASVSAMYLEAINNFYILGSFIAAWVMVYRDKLGLSLAGDFYSNWQYNRRLAKQEKRNRKYEQDIEQEVNRQKRAAEEELERQRREVEEELKRRAKQTSDDIHRQKRAAEDDLERQRKAVEEEMRRRAEQAKREQQSTQSNDSINPYVELGIKPDMAFAEMKQKYKRVSMIYHPDHAGMSKESQDKFKRIQAAWEMIKKKHG